MYSLLEVPVERVNLEGSGASTPNTREEWKKLDFNGLKKQQLGKLDEKLATIKAM